MFRIFVVLRHQMSTLQETYITLSSPIQPFDRPFSHGVSEYKGDVGYPAETPPPTCIP